MASLQGFQEVSLAAPVSKSVMTVTDSVVRFARQRIGQADRHPGVRRQG